MSSHTPEAEEARRLWHKFISTVFAKWDAKTFAQKVAWYEENR